MLTGRSGTASHPVADETFDQHHDRRGRAWSRDVPAALLEPGGQESHAPMDAFLLSTAVIFVAELGDKSQLMAMTFATRYRARQVLLGITIATAVVHLASVGIGRLVGTAFAASQWVVSIAAGVAFLAFAAWTLRGDVLSDAEAAKAARSRGPAVLAVGAAFFLAELGDKTMLATVTLASTEGWLGTWIGSTVGMVLADALAIGVGAVLGRKLPERLIRFGAAALFAVFGVLLVVEGVVTR